jgi:hypothetical protein
MYRKQILFLIMPMTILVYSNLLRDTLQMTFEAELGEPVIPSTTTRARIQVIAGTYNSKKIVILSISNIPPQYSS